MSAETGLEGISFLPSSSRVQAVAVRHSAREILLLSTARGTFVLPATMKVTDVSFGYMDEEGRWVRETDGEVVNRKVTLDGEEHTLDIQGGFVELSDGTVSACVS